MTREVSDGKHANTGSGPSAGCACAFWATAKMTKKIKMIVFQGEDGHVRDN